MPALIPTTMNFTVFDVKRQGDPLRAPDWNQLTQGVRRLQEIAGPYVSNSPAGISHRRELVDFPLDIVLLIDAILDSANIWKYAWASSFEPTEQVTTWTVNPDGVSSTVEGDIYGDPLRNLWENGNDGSDEEGLGTDLNDFPGAMMKRVGMNLGSPSGPYTPVPMFRDSRGAAWFVAPNPFKCSHE